MSSTTSDAAPAVEAPEVRVNTPFPDIPQLRGPLDDGTFVRPANGMTSMFYRYVETDGQWYWTPDAEKSFWMPCSTLLVSQGKWKGKKPAYFNVEIIEYLNAARCAPPADIKATTLEALKEDVTNKPYPAKASEAAKINAALGTSNVQATTVVRNEKDTTKTLGTDDIGPKDTLVFKDCHNSTYTIEAYHTKLHIDDCVNCTFIVNGKVVSAVAELYKCEKINLEINVPVKTLQADKCTGVTATFKEFDMFHSVVWAGTRAINLKITDREIDYSTGFDKVSTKLPELREDIDQFIIRYVEDEMLTEKLIRLANGFPTTQREKDDFDDRQDKNMLAFAKNAGISFVRTEHKGTKAPGRNEKCTCGSGKKYKVCCGAVKKPEKL